MKWTAWKTKGDTTLVDTSVLALVERLMKAKPLYARLNPIRLWSGRETQPCWNIRPSIKRRVERERDSARGSKRNVRNFYSAFE